MARTVRLLLCNWEAAPRAIIEYSNPLTFISSELWSKKSEGVWIEYSRPVSMPFRIVTSKILVESSFGNVPHDSLLFVECAMQLDLYFDSYTLTYNQNVPLLIT